MARCFRDMGFSQAEWCMAPASTGTEQGMHVRSCDSTDEGAAPAAIAYALGAASIDPRRRQDIGARVLRASGINGVYCNSGPAIRNNIGATVVVTRFAWHLPGVAVGANATQPGALSLAPIPVAL
eukprot:COSAG06_NODE_1547_length_9132_cov_3.139046_7_plen_125_part_00